MRYTQAEIKSVLEGYCRRTDAVMDVLRLAPLNRCGVRTVVHSSNDFFVVKTITQVPAAGVGHGTIDDVVVVSRELVLNEKPTWPVDTSFVHDFAGIALEVSEEVFYLVGYDAETMQYIRDHAKEVQKNRTAALMETEKGVPFYLARDTAVSAEIPVKFRPRTACLLLGKKGKKK